MARYLFLGIALTSFAIGWIISHPLEFGICESVYTFGEGTFCLDDSIKHIGEPLLAMSLCILPVALVLLIVDSRAFKSWERFARWWLLIATLIIIATPAQSNSFMDFYFIGKERMTWLMGGLFLIISLLVIARAHFRKA